MVVISNSAIGRDIQTEIWIREFRNRFFIYRDVIRIRAHTADYWENMP